MARLSLAERTFLDRVALTMRDLNLAPNEAIRHVLGRDAAIAKYFHDHAEAREQLARDIWNKLRGRR